jgi:coronin-1B/1C/6
MTDNKQSLAAGASKFADDDDESDKESVSSFEEVAKPVERRSYAAPRQEEKSAGLSASRAPEPAAAKPTPAPTMPATQPGSTLMSSSSSTPAASSTTTSSAPAAGGPASALRDALAEIKSQLEHQNRLLSDQADQVALLVRKVSHLESKLGSAQEPSDREKDERIRQLELELEEARS